MENANQMIFFSAVLRYYFHQYQAICNLLRISKFNLLCPGATIDYKTNIGAHCNIDCVMGGKLDISNCTIKEGTQVFADIYSTISKIDSFVGRNCVITARGSITIKKGLFNS